MANKKSTAGFWDMVLRGEEIISEKEAIELEKSVKQAREEGGFRT